MIAELATGVSRVFELLKSNVLIDSEEIPRFLGDCAIEKCIFHD